MVAQICSQILRTKYENLRLKVNKKIYKFLQKKRNGLPAAHSLNTIQIGSEAGVPKPGGGMGGIDCISPIIWQWSASAFPQ